ncbi:MAG: hypothetical protein H6679_02490 [Epsilonproteobacteria bacterium]|nr:hypothetical protein [Campylobacterota bacterium]
MKLYIKFVFIITFGYSMQLFCAERGESSYLDQTTVLNTSSQNELSFLEQTTEVNDSSFLDKATLLADASDQSTIANESDTLDGTTVLTGCSIELGTPPGYEKVDTNVGSMYLPLLSISPIKTKGTANNKENQLKDPTNPCKNGEKRKRAPLSPIKQSSPLKKSRTVTFNQLDTTEPQPSSNVVINEDLIHTTPNRKGDWYEHQLVKQALQSGCNPALYLAPFLQQVKELYQAIKQNNAETIKKSNITPLYDHEKRKNKQGQTLKQMLNNCCHKSFLSLETQGLFTTYTDSPVVFAMKQENIDLDTIELLTNKLTDQEQQTLLKSLAYERDFQLTPSIKFILSSIFERHKDALGKYESSSIFNALFIQRLIFIKDMTQKMNKANFFCNQPLLFS